MPLETSSEETDMSTKTANGLYTAGMFLLLIIFYIESFDFAEKRNWKYKSQIKTIIFLIYVAIGIYFNLA